MSDDLEMTELQRGLDLYNEQNPPAYNPPALLANYRHLCEKARQAKATGKGVSTAIDLKERYVTAWFHSPNGNVEPAEDPNSELAIIYREGSCKACRKVARSAVGRIVNVTERPPVSGRVARE